MEKWDCKKSEKSLYLPSAPAVATLPAMTFLAVDGRGDPNEPGGEYQRAVGLLYSLAYTIKMSGRGAAAPAGYFDYVVPPLEGLWWNETDAEFDPAQKSAFCWTSLLRQPSFVAPEVLDWARGEVRRKKGLDASAVRLWQWEEGLCAHCLHKGSYDDEPATMAMLVDFAARQGFVPDHSEQRRHHEIYLTDPNRTPPEKRKTLLRIPVRKREEG